MVRALDLYYEALSFESRLMGSIVVSLGEAHYRIVNSLDPGENGYLVLAERIVVNN